MKNAPASVLLLSALAALPATVAAQAPAAAQAATKGTAAAKVAAQSLSRSAAQSLTGTVADSLGRQALPFATVVLQSADDAKTLLSTVSDAQGAFRFEAVPAGRYTLQVRYVGYKAAAPVALTMAADKPAALAPVLLAADRKMLGGVTVTATKPFIEQRADKLVLNVAASPIAAGGTAYDVLGRAPGVLESSAGFQLRGKNVTVLLDGKPTNLAGDELKALLSAMPGNTLDKVEVIANPSARYDANSAAILNIITTKSLKFGTNGVATLGVGAGQYGRYNAGLSLNHRTAKLNVFGGLDRQDNQTYSTTQARRTAGGELEIIENGREVRRSQSNTARLGFDYTLSKTTSFGLTAKGMLNTRDRAADNLAQLGTAAGLASASNVHTDGTAQFLSPSVNLYYKTTLDTTGRTLSLNADYFGYQKDWQNEYLTRNFDGGLQEVGPAGLLRDNSPARNSVHSASADYSQPLYKGTLEAGLKTTFTTTDNDIRWEQATAGQPWTVDAGKTNHFIYRENINAAYGTYARTVQKMSLQVGLRAEQTNTDGTSLTTGQSTQRHYLSFFPSVAAQYNQSEKVQLGFSYSRKIDRFRFGIVNPFVTYISQYRYAQGNPNIRPSFSHNFEFTHSYNSLLTTSISYGHHTDVLVETYQKNDATQVVVNSFDNFRSAESLSASTTLMKPWLNNKWMTVTTLGLEYARINQTASVGLGASRPSAYLSSNHTLTLPKGFKAELSAMYMSPMTFGGLAFQSRFSSSVGVSKLLFKDAATLTLNVTDLFNTQQNRYSVLANGVNSVNLDKVESRFVKLNFSYKFGNKNVKASQRRSTGIEAEKMRMDN
ncbi:outer membrane beta-barrel protein [Hymenobacter monticola]|uniref:TonB-dependent receptor family protein n=1 Tax=Hymenobacter monticola TaxID=1705399 RepID=A0ABY4B7S9_9BACT|nr:outer membrane beta-barrel family protein [Hymenobacter monticola]UOE34352.1 TonB-dependent receptor family protein [Hymenobacter monticola]